jgi:ABC-2 type transport system ATP-binding protein
MDLLHFYRDILRPASGQLEDLTGCFGVSSWLDTPAGTWSAGMCKKVSLLLAFIGQPKLILLDEPLVTLDREGVAALYALIARRHRDEGVSFILSSHQPLAEQALPEVRELIFMNQRIVAGYFRDMVCLRSGRLPDRDVRVFRGSGGRRFLRGL